MNRYHNVEQLTKAEGVPKDVIVTTRRGGFAVMGQVLDLYVIGLPDAVRMLRARVPGLGRVGRTVSRSRRSWAGFATAQPGRRALRPRPGQRPA